MFLLNVDQRKIRISFMLDHKRITGLSQHQPNIFIIRNAISKRFSLAASLSREQTVMQSKVLLIQLYCYPLGNRTHANYTVIEVRAPSEICGYIISYNYSYAIALSLPE